MTCVNGAGEILGTRVVVEDGAPKSDPRVAWTGRDWIVTWLEAESTWGLPRALRGAQLRADDFEAFVFDILRD
ncbi:MAG: hypothetical protein WA208_02415, partial [Thermoanaerobaculia bacterium]